MAYPFTGELLKDAPTLYNNKKDLQGWFFKKEFYNNNYEKRQK